MRKSLLLTGCLSVALLAGCAAGNHQVKNMTTSSVDAVFAQKQMTQAQVI